MSQSSQKPLKLEEGYASSQPVCSSSGRTRASSQPEITPIAELNPSSSNWTIVAKVSSKTPITRSQSGVLYMHVILLDSSGEIKAKFFEDVCYLFDHSLRVGKLYYISRAVLRSSDPLFNLVHPYEIIFTESTLVKPAIGLQVPQLSQHFTPLSALGQLALYAQVDVIGVATEISDLYLAQSEQEIWGRKITLTDDSNAQVLVSLWGQRALNFHSKQSIPVVAIKNAKITDNKEMVKLTVTSRSVMEIDPEIAAAETLRKWFTHKDVDDEGQDKGSSSKKVRSD